MSLSASLNFSGGGGTAKFVQSQVDKFSSYSLYAVVKVNVALQPEQIRNVRLTPEAIDLANSSSERFRKVCGDEFVTSIAKGGEFYAVIDIKTQSESHKNQISKELGGSYGVFSGKAELKNTLEKISKHSEIFISMYHRGGSVNTTTDVNELLLEAEKFSTLLTPENASQYLVTTISYDSLFIDGVQLIDTENQKEVLSKLGESKLDMMTFLNDSRYVLNHPEQFESFDGATLQQQANIVRQNINKIHDKASKCYRSINSCDLVTLDTFSTSLPNRLPGTPEKNCSLQENKQCGVKTFLTSATEACGPFRYNRKEDELCGVLLYKSKPTNKCPPLTYKAIRNPSCGIEVDTKFKGGFRNIIQGIKVESAWAKKTSWGCKRYSTDGRCEDGCPATCSGYEYKIPRVCRIAENGVETYASCRSPNHGVESYQTCEDPSFGIAEYRTCRDPSHGVERYNICEIDLNTGNKCD